MFDQVSNEVNWPSKAGIAGRMGPFFGCAETALIAEQAPKGKLTVVLTSDQTEARTIQRELPFFLSESIQIHALPDWETLPYDTFSPHADIISERLKILYQLPDLQSGILIIPVSTAMHIFPPLKFVNKYTFILKKGQTLDIESFRRRLDESGYRNVDTVIQHGEFAIRGSLFDLFPMGSSYPYRVDLFDTDIESLREFDPETQRTKKMIEKIEVLPAREFPLDEEGIQLFKMNWYKTFENDPDLCPIFQEVINGKIPSGCEYYLPLFFSECASIFDYLPASTPFFTVGNWRKSMELFWSDIITRHAEYGIDIHRPFLAPSKCFIPPELFCSKLLNNSIFELCNESSSKDFIKSSIEAPPIIATNQSMSDAMNTLKKFIFHHEAPVLICAESISRRELLIDALNEQGLVPKIERNWSSFIHNKTKFAITQSPIDRGLYFGKGQPALICESQLFSRQVAQRRLRKPSSINLGNNYRELTELKKGEPVVHLEHGVGIYIGLEVLNIENALEEFLTLEYQGGSRLYVPVSSLKLISRYSTSDSSNFSLNRLGSASWESARKKATAKVNDIAADLLEIYARREAKSGFKFALHHKDYEKFCASFPFEETPDQIAAISAVIDDMTSGKVMDRLVCGDVGFGKTEVAMRAAFLAAVNKKQTVLLVPTTLLAQQHHTSFLDRFAGWPISIELISRFRKKEDVRSLNKDISNGTIDILIGTHKLLHSNFSFKDLGLLVIDEEHRFGVKQKDSIKALRAEIDILTLTATPIPRTLNMAFEGIRDLSIIASPPKDRLAINTFVQEYSASLVKEAISREILRGGQVFYVHNEVKTIERTADIIREINPALQIAVAHGKMRESQLEKVMSEFYKKKFDILVCTTIIETGIDIPNVNTIIIERADKLGLAQLYQLRGRVGRSHHQAYAYLLVPSNIDLRDQAAMRLQAIENSCTLGSGFILATRDLEIRGAGEILGDDQSGQIQNIGFSFYIRLLKKAVKSLREGKIPEDEQPSKKSLEINLHAPALISDSYLPNVNTRLLLYKRIAAARSDEDLKEIQLEMLDRFGLFDDGISNLFEIARLRLHAEALGLTRIDIGHSKGIFEFSELTKVHPNSIIDRIQNKSSMWKLISGTKLQVTCDLNSLIERQNFAESIINEFFNELKQYNNDEA